MVNAAHSNDFPNKTPFRPAGGVFKLVPAPHPSTGKFKPEAMREVVLAAPAQPTPTEFGHLGISSKSVQAPVPAAAAPPASPPPPAVLPMPAPEDDDAKIMAKFQRLLAIQKRAADLEQENDLLLQMVNRLKAENAALRAK